MKHIMKHIKNSKGSIKLGILSALLVLGTVASLVSHERLQKDDVRTDQLQAIMIEGWEVDNWRAETNPAPPQGTIKMQLVNGFPASLGYMNLDKKTNQKSQGVQFQFVYPGDNVVEIIPPETRKVKRYLGSLTKDLKPAFEEVPGIELVGKVKAISVWVLGRGNEYDLECWVEDWRGYTHVLKFGSLDFVGWQPLKVQIPIYVPQDVSSFPATKTLIFKKFVVRAQKKASKEKVNVFIDSLTILTDVYDVYFDGADVSFDGSDQAYKDFYRNYVKILKRYTEGEKIDFTTLSNKE